MAFDKLRNLRPVKRYRSEGYVLVSLVTFAVSVLVLRVVLKLTGYAQIGSDSVHIAHVLWGGLALFAGALLLMVLSNRWALTVGAVLTGGGVGLFIDEVGKFITRSNNYFTPAAAPIIYALFLATVLLYLHVRRPPSKDVRGEMYRALDQISGVLDHEMSRHDLLVLHRRLESLECSAEDVAVRRLAAAMLEFVDAQQPRIAETAPGRAQRCSATVRAWCRRSITRTWLRVALAVFLLGLGLYSVLDIALLGFLAIAPGSESADLLRALVSPGELAALADKIWFSVRAIFEGGVGVLLLAGGMLISMRREWRGLALAVTGLVCGLTVVNLLIFYDDQLEALILTGLEYVLLLAAYFYRRVYLAEESEEAERAGVQAERRFAEALREAAAEAGVLTRDAS
jgi:hypothetical protein